LEITFRSCGVAPPIAVSGAPETKTPFRELCEITLPRTAVPSARIPTIATPSPFWEIVLPASSSGPPTAGAVWTAGEGPIRTPAPSFRRTTLPRIDTFRLSTTSIPFRPLPAIVLPTPGEATWLLPTIAESADERSTPSPPFPSTAFALPTPTRLPAILAPVAPTTIPFASLPATTLRTPGVLEPPISAEPPLEVTSMPIRFPATAFPVVSPTKLPWIVARAPSTSMPASPNLTMSRSFTVTDEAESVRPSVLAPAAPPSTVISGSPANPGCVLPSIVADSVIAGSRVAGAIVCAPEPIENAIRSSPADAFASWIAARSVHGACRTDAVAQTPLPGATSGESPVDVTTNVRRNGMVTQFENSDVSRSPLAFCLVAVAVMACPGVASTPPADAANDTLPDPSVVLIVDWIGFAPSPWPLPSQALLE